MPFIALFGIHLTFIEKKLKAEEATKEASENFNTIYYNSYNAISTIVGDRFAACNQAFVEILNASDINEV